jgi:hypothetical protein
MEAGSTSRMQTALRVLSTHCKLGETATPEDVEKVRSWAGDETLSPADAAAVIVWRELEERRDGIDRAVEAATSPRGRREWEKGSGGFGRPDTLGGVQPAGINFTERATKAASPCFSGIKTVDE